MTESDKTSGPDESERLVDYTWTCTRLGVNRGTLARKVAAGEFPAPSYLWGRARWRLKDVQAFEEKHLGSKPGRAAGNLRNAKASP